MATNPYVNKVQLADGTTIMDLTPTTAVASDVASGKYFFTASGQLTLGSASGGTAAISVVDTTDTAGGTIRAITALDISDTTAVASDVASGKYFYTADGTKTAGTASGGSGGLEYETGTWTPSEDVNSTIISLSKTHTNTPFSIYVMDTGDFATASTNSLLYYIVINWVGLMGSPIYTGSGTVQYGRIRTGYRTSSATNSSASNLTNQTAFEYYVSTSQFVAGTGGSQYWRAGRTYKWIAVWAPTT